MSCSYQCRLLVALVLMGTLPLALGTALALALLHQALGDLDPLVAVGAGALGLEIGTVFMAVLVALALGSPLQALRDGLALMLGPNRRHRLAPPAERDLAELARGINALADQSRHAQEQVEAVTRALLLEKETLASVLFALADGVVVCNAQCQVVLSNAAAQQLLALPARPLRRGESIFAYLNAALLRPLVDALATAAAPRRLEEGILTLPRGIVVHVALTRVQDDAGQPHYIFVLRDITRQVAAERSHTRFIRDALRRLRGPVASLLSGAEILRAYRELPAARQQAFLDALYTEAERLATELEALQAAASSNLAPGWADDLSLRALIEQAVTDLAPLCAARGAQVLIEGDDVPVRGDRLALLQVVRRLLAWSLERAVAGSQLTVRWSRLASGLVEVTLPVPGGRLAPGESERLFEQPLPESATDPPGSSATLLQVVEEHGGAVWEQRSPEGAALVLSLPLPPHVARPASPRGDTVGQQVRALLGHGGFYDLAPAVAVAPAQAEARLDELAFVVLDLETTGLDPDHDAVVAIGAVRVRRGRVIPEDHFLALVDPGRPIPPAATRIHGITDELVAGQPRLEAVLPPFVAYCSGSVPVAHVAWFDLAFLNPALKALGQPPFAPGTVLDTVLLCSALFPTWAGYNLEEIADRFALPVVGRHTALGDALLTAEIFCRLLHVLEQRGIMTLGAALRFQSGDVVRKLIAAVRTELARS
jgi:DNA polymerase-3 subunit epsilon